MPSPAHDPPAGSPERALLDAIAKKSLAQVKQIIDEAQELDLNFVDHDELSPLQHACHSGDVELTRLLISNGADVNFTQRKDGYTALMFAAISSKAAIVRLLLERGVDTTAENCVNRTASQMAAFVGQYKSVSIINSWISYSNSIEPYTRTRELESQPRIPTKALGHLLHNFLVFPSLHPVKLMLFVKENSDLAKYGSQFIYVLEDLCSKSIKPPANDETQSMKYHYLSYILKYCIKVLNDKKSSGGDSNEKEDSFDNEAYQKSLQNSIRKLIKRARPEDREAVTPQLDALIIDCLYRYPYTQTSIYKTTTFALNKRQPGMFIAHAVLIQILNGPLIFGALKESCSICKEVTENKKCGKCQIVYYCSHPCQVIDWFQHKKVCKSHGE